MTGERKQMRSGLGKILRSAVFYGAALVLLIPVGKCLHNDAAHNYSRVAETSETHTFTVGLDSWVEYSKFIDGAKEVKVYPGSLDMLAKSLPFDSFDMRTYDGGSQVQEIRIIGNKLRVKGLSSIKTRDRDYRNYLQSFNYGDELLAAARQRAETRKSNGDINQDSEPILFNFSK